MKISRRNINVLNWILATWSFCWGCTKNPVWILHGVKERVRLTDLLDGIFYCILNSQLVSLEEPSKEGVPTSTGLTATLSLRCKSTILNTNYYLDQLEIGFPACFSWYYVELEVSGMFFVEINYWCKPFYMEVSLFTAFMTSEGLLSAWVIICFFFSREILKFI